MFLVLHFGYNTRYQFKVLCLVSSFNFANISASLSNLLLILILATVVSAITFYLSLLNFIELTVFGAMCYN